jgi:hypothetical protein
VWGLEVQLHILLVPVSGGECSASRHGHFFAGERASRKLSGWQRRSDDVKKKWVVLIILIITEIDVTTSKQYILYFFFVYTIFTIKQAIVYAAICYLYKKPPYCRCHSDMRDDTRRPCCCLCRHIAVAIAICMTTSGTLRSRCDVTTFLAGTPIRRNLRRCDVNKSVLPSPGTEPRSLGPPYRGLVTCKVNCADWVYWWTKTNIRRRTHFVDGKLHCCVSKLLLRRPK